MTNREFAERMKMRTKNMSIDIIRSSSRISGDYAGHVAKKQLIRSATSVAANYRAACRARSTAEFISKLGIVEEEADETCFWIELILESELADKKDFETVHEEIKEITAIVTASIQKTRSRYKR